jgi:phosphatidylglycerol---prolipoprotein diacylglyceryl transferase
MDFQRDLVTLTVDGLRYYGFVVAAIIVLVSMWNARQDIRKGRPNNQVYTELGVMAAIAAAIAIAVYSLIDTGEQQVQIRYYGIIIVVAMLVATIVAASLAKRAGRDPEHVYGALTWAIIPGIILARLWFVFFPPEGLCDLTTTICYDTTWMLENFFDTSNGAIAIWSGGLSIFGAILGGFIGTYLYLWKNKLTIPAWLDYAGLVLPLSQAIGRWANYVNQELFGKPICSWESVLNNAGEEITRLCNPTSWGLTIPVEKLPDIYLTPQYFNAKFHPLFLYESVWSLIAFFVLLWVFNKHRNRFRPGDFFLLYVAQYSFIRFLLEFLRVEVTKVGDVNLSQLVTAIAFAIAVGLLVFRHRGADIQPYDEAAPPEVSTQKENLVEIAPIETSSEAGVAAESSEETPAETV